MENNKNASLGMAFLYTVIIYVIVLSAILTSCSANKSTTQTKICTQVAPMR